MYIFGIKLNGLSQLIETISINDDQTMYDYICNISPTIVCDGNGEFVVSILNKNMINGLPIGKWTLLEGTISYDWGQTRYSFILLDEYGESLEYRTSHYGGSKSSYGYSVEALAKLIFTKANEIVSKYPSAKVFKAFADFYMPLNFKEKLINLKVNDNPTKIIECFEKQLEWLSNYFQTYNKIKKLLEGEEDIKSVRLLKRATNDCLSIIDLLNTSGK